MQHLVHGPPIASRAPGRSARRERKGVIAKARLTSNGSLEARMSKLMIAFVHNDDAEAVSEALRSAGHRFTLLPSVGGFLGTDNATFVFGVDDDAEQPVIDVFERVCHGRNVAVPLVLLDRLADWKARTVTHGGATILVADLERIVRI
jgi:uncharacterized protein YaaQ